MIRYERRFHHGLYRSRSGAILGVCRGLADYFGISAFWIRLVAVILLLATGLWPITILYFIAAFLMKPEPFARARIIDGPGYHDRCMYSGQGAFDRLRRKFKTIEGRIRRMEDIVTDRAYDWERRMRT